MISLKQLAELCSVSEATVSKSLHNRPGVNAETREKIKKIAKQFNYQPNALVRSIQSGKTLMIGIACDHFKNIYAGMIMAGVQKTLFARGYDIIVIPWGLSDVQEADIFRTFAERRVDGLLVFPPDELPTPKYIAELRRASCPLVLIDQSWPGCEFDFIGSEDAQGAIAITDHLISLGHRKIANFYYDAVTTGRSRLEGFQSSMSHAGLAVHQKWLVNIADLQHDAYVQARRLLSSKDRPTAIICFNDHIAMQVLAAAWDLKIAVPDSLSVAGFADLWITEDIRPRLTTVRQDGEKIGIKAAELLLDRIKQQEKKSADEFQPRCVLIPTKLVVRDSTTKIVSE
jgi:DNA-binding LacI/PurR family transcriptional regulator